MGISINGPSGIDTASLIDQLVALETTRVTKVETQKSAFQVKIDAYSKLRGMLADLSAKATALKATTGFNLFKSTSSDDSAVALRGSTGATEGGYDFKVFQVAQAEKMISSDGRITSQSVSLASLGISTGTISINGTTIDIDGDDTLQDLRMKINTASDSLGKPLAVGATVMKVSDSNYRLVLSAKDTGVAGISYKDVSGTVLQDLGIIASADGAKGSVAQALVSGAPLPAINAGDIIQYAGLDHNGNKVTGTYIASSSDPAGLLQNIKDTFHGMVSATIDGSGNLVITDQMQGTSRLKIDSLSVGAATVTMGISSAGREGAGVLSLGMDAYFSVDNINLTSAKNSTEGIIGGVTIDIKKISAETSVHATIARDFEGIEKKMNDLLGSYNALLNYGATATKIGNPKDKSSKSGDLAGDLTISTILSQVRAAFHTNFGQFGWEKSSLTNLGMKTDPKSGQLSLDSTVFRSALETDFDGVTRLFTETGYSSTNALTLGRSTKNTSSGNYLVEEVDANYLRIQQSGDPTWYTSNSRMGDLVEFASGPATGLTLNAAAGSLGGLTAGFAYSKGVGIGLSELVDKLNDPNEGLLSLRQKTYENSIRSADARIIKLNISVDAYRTRLVKQFSNMEQMINQMKSQSANMLSQLGISGN